MELAGVSVVRRVRRRRSRPRAQTTAVKKIRGYELRADQILLHDELVVHARTARPLVWGDCRDAPRPCPWVGCSKHLYLDINPETGSIKINFPDLEPWELKDSCSLDVASRGGVTLEEVGEIMNLTRERVRQLEVRALIQIKRSAFVAELGT